MWVLQGLSASCWGDQCEGTGCQLLESHWRCGHPCPLLSASGVSGVWASATGDSGDLGCQPMGWDWSVFPKPATRGTRVNEWLSVSSWSRKSGYSSCACCQLMRTSVCAFPRLGAGRGCLYMCWQAPSWTRQWVGDLKSGQGCQVGRGSVLVFRGISECGEPVEWMCVCFTSAVSTQLDQTESWGPVGDLRSGQRCGVGRRDVVSWACVWCESCIWVLLKAAPYLWPSMWLAISVSSVCACEQQ